jgi:DNA-binding beta-propeller fold protein YncE
VWVADTSNDRVEEFGPDGAFIRTFGFGVSDGQETFEVCTSNCRAGIVGSGDGQFERPEGLTVDSHGDVWVSDSPSDRIQEFSPQGAFIRAFGSPGPGNGQLSNPEGLAVDSHGDVWVADTGNGRIEEFSEEGTYMQTLNTYADDVAIDSSGHLWLAAGGNNQNVIELNPDGTLIREFGSGGSGNGQFNDDRRLSIGPEGNVWVADTWNERIQVFSPTGEYLFQFGTEGSGNGQFERPDAVAIDGLDVYVLDRDNHRIEKWIR